MKQISSFKNTAIVVGAAFLLSGIIKLILRGATDVDIFVGLIFLAFGFIAAILDKKPSK